MKYSELKDVKYHYVKLDKNYIDNDFNIYNEVSGYIGENNILLVEFKDGIQLIYMVKNGIPNFDIHFSWEDQIDIRNKATGESWINTSKSEYSQEKIDFPMNNQLSNTNESFYRDVILKLIEKL